MRPVCVLLGRVTSFHAHTRRSVYRGAYAAACSVRQFLIHSIVHSYSLRVQFTTDHSVGGLVSIRRRSVVVSRLAALA